MRFLKHVNYCGDQDKAPVLKKMKHSKVEGNFLYMPRDSIAKGLTHVDKLCKFFL